MSFQHAGTLVLIAFIFAGCASTPPADYPLHRLLSSYEQDGFSGTVLVANDGRILLHRGYGFANRERGIRNDKDTLFEVASIVKTFTSAAILDLEARGVLRTSDPLSRFLGPFPPAKASATIDHLATHTGGLVPEGTDLRCADREEFIQDVKSVPLESVPGQAYRYSNAGFSTLAALIEKVSGVSFETYLRENLFARAGLTDAYFRGDANVPRHRVAVGYGADGKPSTPPPYQWGTRGSGGLILTVREVYRWYTALRGGRVIDAKQVWKMFEPRPPPREGYAFHSERDAKGRWIISKGGGMPEYASQILEYPEERVVIIWACNNLDKRWRQAVNRGIAATLFGGDLPPLPADAQ